MGTACADEKGDGVFGLIFSPCAGMVLRLRGASEDKERRGNWRKRRGIIRKGKRKGRERKKEAHPPWLRLIERAQSWLITISTYLFSLDLNGGSNVIKFREKEENDFRTSAAEIYTPTGEKREEVRGGSMEGGHDEFDPA